MRGIFVVGTMLGVAIMVISAVMPLGVLVARSATAAAELVWAIACLAHGLGALLDARVYISSSTESRASRYWKVLGEIGVAGLMLCLSGVLVGLAVRVIHISK